jgi:RNA polymerase sigma-70 factor (ECF subfamily)
VQRDLVERARGGDHDAFAALVRPAIPRLTGAAELITRDPERAQEALQNALIRAWRDLPGLRDPDKFDAWIYRMLVRACYDEFRKGRRHVALDLSPDVQTIVVDPATSIEDRDRIEAGLRRLDATARALIVLHYYADLSLPVVAEALDMPLGTAKSRLHRAVLSLRAAFEADEHPVVEGSLA